MKQTIDIIQILLSMPGAWGYAGSLVCVLIVWQWFKLIRRAWQALCWIVGKLVISFHTNTDKGRRISWLKIAACLIFAGVIFAARKPIHDVLQEFKQRHISPIYAVSDTSAFALRCYEMELSRHCSEKELQVVKSWTEKTAAAIGCAPLDIYQVAYVECSLDPFRVRTDGGAAGWIQFTNTGLDGLGASLGEVKAACKLRDTEYIMALSYAYLTQFGKPLPDAPAVYVAVAAAGHAGQTDAAHVIYTRSQHPNEYNANSALWDGWTVERGKVLRLARNIDGRITVGDLAGCLAAKKTELLKKY